MSKHGRWIHLAVAVAATPWLAQAQQAAPNAALDAYARPGELVDIGGRKLNVRCSGSGTPAVLLESGNNADSMAWFKVQPEVAKFARVCSYDRAGTGFSDGGPLPRNLDANADDAAALIKAAHLPTPVVLVGHSYGTNVVRRVADRHAADVAAIVLLDPPPQHVAEFAPAFDKLEEQDRVASLKALQGCVTGAEKGQLDTAPELKPCLRPPNPAYSPALNAAIHANKLKPSFWKTMLSIIENNGALYGAPVSKTENHGAIPLLILQPDKPFAGEEPPAEFAKGLEAARQKTQKAIAATSTRGRIIPVADSSHDVQFDQPDVVIDTISAAIHLAQASTKKAGG